ncbi:HPP family protein [Streptomyces nigra]|uniref:CBS domain-containing protein n=1 Tax=Streptomyces nigra TaxID=1827580 RepID=UPI0036B20B0C
MMTRIVGEVMTGEVVEARRETPAGELARLLDRHRIGGLPVLDHDDKVVGVVARADLAGRRARCTAAEVMSTPAVTVHPEQRVAAAARVMERHRVDRLPVVDEEDRLIGIATRRDLLRVFLRTDDEIRREVTDAVLPRVLSPTGPCAVTVSVRDGVVTLAGRLSDPDAVALAVRSVWRVDGVVGVVNHLTGLTDLTGLTTEAGPGVSPGRRRVP